MKTCIFSIFDSACHAFGPCMTFENFDVAKRAFREFLDHAPDTVACHAEDLTLCMVGQFDPVTGQLESYISNGLFLGQVIADNAPLDDRFMYVYLPSKIDAKEEL